jgi:hypothetical protein
MQSEVLQAKAGTQPMAERQTRRDKVRKYFIDKNFGANGRDWSIFPAIAHQICPILLVNQAYQPYRP